jgi:hypothetical protein
MNELQVKVKSDLETELKARGLLVKESLESDPELIVPSRWKDNTA